MSAQAAEYGRLYEQYKAACQELLCDPVTLAAGLAPDYRVRGHLRVVGQAFADMAAGVHDRTMVVLPPQVGKSEAASRWGVFWWLVKHPHHKIILVCHTQALANKHSRRVRDFITEHGHLFGLKLAPGNAAVQDWSLVSGGGLFALGTGGSSAGNPADALFLDDLLKGRVQAESKGERDKSHAIYGDDLLSRLAPGAPVILTGTRWHEDDPQARILRDEGRLEDGGAWHVVHMPAIADLALTGGTDPLGRATGDPLPHPKIEDGDTERLSAFWGRRKDAVSRVSRNSWASLYQGDPKPREGALLKAEQNLAIRFPGQAAPAVRSAVAVDPSGVGHRDTAGIVGGHLGTDGRLWVTHDRTGNLEVDEWARAAAKLAMEIDADAVVVEQDYGGNMPKTLIRGAWERLAEEWDTEHDGDVDAGANPYRSRIAPAVENVKARKAKVLRAEPVAGQMREDRIRYGAFMTELENEWETWQPGSKESPGRIDAMVYLAYHLLPVPGTSTQSGSVAGSTWADLDDGEPPTGWGEFDGGADGRSMWGPT
ncbi:terminase large subunit domain-containing protein [Streptomyces sp. NPDC087300]|uniref:terminase large subunit domain-containing protein n=1 Tax=Streptomyces sp. NPDC087300 TaxID=3365780 RepID=UPI0037FB5B04